MNLLAALLRSTFRKYTLGKLNCEKLCVLMNNGGNIHNYCDFSREMFFISFFTRNNEKVFEYYILRIILREMVLWRFRTHVVKLQY